MKVYAFVHEEDGSFGISFPDFPGCISTGDTLEATKITASKPFCCIATQCGN